jgi:glycosyltransferase involved in cell wall biosynthesis
VGKAPLVSVITPVHNGEKYIAECIESIVRQTLTDWEYLIADNVSTDGTLTIAQKFAAQDPRIRILSFDDFVDIYTNHNRALHQMNPHSRYCKFVHADDWLFPECLEKMVAVAEANEAVGIVSAYRLADRSVQLDGLVPYSQTTMSGREVVRKAVLGTSSDWVVGSPTALLLSNDLIREEQRFFDPKIWHADTEAAFRSMLRTDFGFVHQVLTFTRVHPEALSSLTYRVHSLLPFEGRLIARFGQRVLASDEHLQVLHRWLRRYSLWMGKQMLIPRRYADPEFYSFHISEIEGILTEPGVDLRTRVSLSAWRTVLQAQRSVALFRTSGARETASM